MIESRTENRAESTEEKVGEGVGGVGGALVGAGLGSIAGPVGTIVGGVAGAVGGWWAGEKAGRALDNWTDKEEHEVRNLYDERDESDVDYDAARSAYVSGYVAADNPDYHDYGMADTDFRENWGWDKYEYDRLSPYVRAGFDRRSSSVTV